MRRGAAHLTFVLADPARAEELRSVLEEHGVDYAAVVAHPWSVRRSLMLGENDFVIMCIALDKPTLHRHGKAIRQLLSDHRCFPTALRTVGLLSDLGLTREAAELGCDVYVEDTVQAAKAIRLIEEASSNMAHQKRDRLRLRGAWMVGSPKLPAEVMSLVSTEVARSGELSSYSIDPFDRTGVDFGDPLGPP
jgi:hypothetical protein